MAPHDDWTYFGVWPVSGLKRVSELLESLEVRNEVYAEILSEDRLRSWCAWDPNSAEAHKGFHLFIHRDDLNKVGDQIVVMFPERNFDR